MVRPPVPEYRNGSTSDAAQRAAEVATAAKQGQISYRTGGNGATTTHTMGPPYPHDEKGRLPGDPMDVDRQDGQYSAKRMSDDTSMPGGYPYESNGASFSTSNNPDPNVPGYTATEIGSHNQEHTSHDPAITQKDYKGKYQSTQPSGSWSETSRSRHEKSHGDDKTSSVGLMAQAAAFIFPQDSSEDDLKRRNKKLNQDLKAAEKKNIEQQSRIYELERQSGVLGSRINGYKRDINTLDRKNREQLARTRDVENLANERLSTVMQQGTELKSLSLEVAQLTQQNTGMEHQIHAAQLAMSKKPKPKLGLADEERTITGNFMNLHDEIRKWAKKWGGEGFSAINDLISEEKDEFLKQLAKVVVLDNGQIPSILRSKGIRSSMLCISALIGQYICAEVFDAPFRPLRQLANQGDEHKKDKSEQSQPQPQVLSDIVLKDMYNKLSELDKARAQVWRSEMMTILDPTSTDDVSDALLKAQHDAAERRTQAASALTSAFLDASFCILLPHVKEDDVVTRQDELQSIFQNALNMAGRLWKQLTIVKCVYLEDLKKKSFSYESELMGAHAFHKLGFDDEEEDRLDKHDIRIVVFPAVKGYGNSSGENYSQDRVWGKAIVWLDE